jgi:LPS-assembly protein
MGRPSRVAARAWRAACDLFPWTRPAARSSTRSGALRPNLGQTKPMRVSVLTVPQSALASALICALPALAASSPALAATLAEVSAEQQQPNPQPAPQADPQLDPRPGETVRTNRLPPVPRQFGRATAPAPASGPAPAAPSGAEVLLEADTLEEEADTSVIVARGNVIARNRGRTLRADQLTYNRATGIVTASGSVTVVEEDGTASFADELTVDEDMTAGVIRGFALRLPENAVLAANSALRREGQRVVLSQMVYTACEICEDGSREPTWTIRARQALQSVPDKTITYNDLVFEVAGQPVLWLPWFRHPDPTAGRQSGFLQPTPGRSGRYGYNVSLPYHLLLGEHSDVTFTPNVYQFINPMLEVDFRRAFHSGDLRLEGSLTRESFFRRLGRNFGEKDWRGSLFGQGLFAINDTWRWGFGLENASDDTYLQRYDLDGPGAQRGLVRGQASRLVSQLYLTGQSERFFARALSVNFQDLGGFAARKEPPMVLPLLEATRSFSLGPMNGRADVFGSALRLDRREGRLDSARVSAGARWRGQRVMGPGIIIEPQLFARSDWFSYDNPALAAGATQSVSRTVGLASLDVRWPLQRVDRFATWTVEPRLMVTLASEDGDQARIFNEDSVGFEFDATTQFRPNAAAGSDFWDGGASVTAGVTLGARVGDRTQVQWFVGSRWRDTPALVADRVSNLGLGTGDIVSDLQISWNDTVSVAARTRLDPDTGSLIRTEVEARLRSGPLTLTSRYHRLSEDYAPPDRANHEVFAQAELRLPRGFGLIVGGTRDLVSQRNLREVFGITWKDDCTEIRLLADRNKTANRFIEPTSSIRLEVAFRTLGVLDPDPLN